MKIVGGHDYYDVGMRLGIDYDVRFIRKNNYIELNSRIPVCPYCFRDRLMLDAKDRILRPSAKPDFILVTVVFCGRVYWGIKLSYSGTVFWTVESIVKYLADHGIHYHPNNFSVVGGIPLRLGLIDDESTQRVDSYCIENGYAILIYEYNFSLDRYNNDKKVLVNSVGLKGLEFYKVVDPYQAYQQLGMFVSNLSHPDSPMVQIIDEKIIVAKHGFDKHSFRSSSPSTKTARGA